MDSKSRGKAKHT